MERGPRLRKRLVPVSCLATKRSSNLPPRNMPVMKVAACASRNSNSAKIKKKLETAAANTPKFLSMLSLYYLKSPGTCCSS